MTAKIRGRVRYPYSATEKKAHFLWRNGLDTNGSLAEIHQGYAREELKRLHEEEGFTVLKQWIADQGWLDGFMVIYAIIVRLGENNAVESYTVHWHDGNREFFKALGSRGSVPLL